MGGKPAAFAVMNAFRLIKVSNNLGDSKSLMTHPSSTTHRRLSLEVQKSMNITETTVRLSVGLEHPQDLIKDLEIAFKAMK